MNAARRAFLPAVFSLCFIAATAFLTGCVPAPAITQRSPQISGRVLNAATREPVPGALVSLHKAPRFRHATTDQSGHFLLKESWNLRLWIVFGVCGAEAEAFENLGEQIDITHAAFHSERIYVPDHRARTGELFRGHSFEETRDILLRPKRH